MQAASVLPIHIPPTRAVAKFTVQSSDVLQDMRINVSAEGSDQVIWFKERFLSDEEIVEHIVHNPTSTICWTIHRPKRGWYIRVRSPTFPPGVFIPITPVPPDTPHHLEGALKFSSRTNAIQSTMNLTMPRASADAASIHSYPPTPPPVVVTIDPPSPTGDISDINIDCLHQATSKLSSKAKPPLTQITDFILAPLSSAPSVVESQPRSFISRAFSFLKHHSPHHSNSFTLARMLSSKGLPLSPPPPYASESEQSHKLPTATPALPSSALMMDSLVTSPLLTFHDHTPVLTVGSVTGLLELDVEESRALGIDTGFWIAIALTYLQFLEERESYLAAMND
ncbi:hypothetical protein ONZ45_g19224 [Pleurotus djamor]|nr:hypothetical protein ONZ45_g19224 [Pleurotus djamor]